MIKPFLDLCRVSNLPTVWTNVLAATVLAAGGFHWPEFIILAVSMSLFYSGGMCLNDILDIKTDRMKRPDRPIPSGRISSRSSGLFTIILFAAALFLLMSAPYKEAVYAGLILLVFIIAYDMAHKTGLFGVVLMAGCRFMVFAACSAAVAGELIFTAAAAGLIQFVYTAAVSITARYEHRRQKPFSFPVIPLMIACMSVIDGVVLAVLVSPAWLAAGISGTALTLLGQRYVRGD